MHDFIGRKPELALLEKELSRENGFVVLYGRRRVGKTTLIKEFIKDKKALYFLASQETEPLNMQRFASDVSHFTEQSIFESARFEDWRPLFQAIADYLPEEKKILVIDELPYLVQGNSAFPSILQYAWDEILRPSCTMLILCGSSISMMESATLAYSSPLYGRRTAQIRLKPFRFPELREAFPLYSYSKVVELYALTGGIPKYLEFFSGKASLWTDIKENILDTSGFLYEEPLFLLEQEVRDPVNYLSIMKVIANGNRKLSEITRSLEKKHAEITPYLKTLIGLGYVERRVPFTEEQPDKSKRGLYYISDTFIEFWFRYVMPYVGDLELGNMRPSLEKLEKTFQSNFIPFVFESVCREVLFDLCMNGNIKLSPSRIGSYWDNQGSVEIDVGLVDNEHQAIFLGECKYLERKAVSTEPYKALRAKASSIPAPTDKPPILGIFSKSGFSEQLIRLSEAEGNLVLINEDRVV